MRNAIYDDMRWFNRAKYLPEGSDEDPFMYVRKELDEGLRELTELQREVLFRTVINGESTESVARDKQCSSRNIQDIRARALKHLRSKITKREGSGKPSLVIIDLLLMLLVGVPLICWGEGIGVTYPWLEPVAAVFAALLIVFMFRKDSRRETEDQLRQHWASLNGSKKE